MTLQQMARQLWTLGTADLQRLRAALRRHEAASAAYEAAAGGDFENAVDDAFYEAASDEWLAAEVALCDLLAELGLPPVTLTTYAPGPLVEGAAG